MKYIVYCTINLLNDKFYVGVHETENPDVFDGYLGNQVKVNCPNTFMRPRSAFQFAVKKFGTKSFKRITLFVYDTLEEAYRKEREIVNKEFIESDYNYNYVINERSLDSINQFNISGKLIKHWRTIEEAAEFYNCSVKLIKNQMNRKYKLFDSYWSKNKSIDVNEYSEGKPVKTVYKYTEKGKLISELTDVTNEIINAIKTQDLLNGYFYSFSLTDEFQQKPRTFLKNKNFYVETPNGIKEFKDIKELYKFIGLHSNIKIYDIIKNKDGVYKNFKIHLKNPVKQIDVFDKLGKYQGTYDSVKDIATKFGIDTPSINRVLRGLSSIAGGYVFKYKK